MDVATHDLGGWKEGGKEDWGQGLLSWAPLLHQTGAPAKQDQPPA